MNKEETKKAIEVMQAYVDGKEIELSNKERYASTGKSNWRNFVHSTPLWDWDEFDYRIKPEPLELWVNVYPDNKTGMNYKTLEEALANGATALTTIRMVQADE